MGAVYEVYLYSDTGAQLACLTKRLTRLEWNRVLCDQGSFAITLSDKLSAVDVAMFKLNCRVAIYRKPDPLGMSQLMMLGFIRGFDFETDIRGITRYTWYGPDQVCLLGDRICFPWHPYTGGFWLHDTGSNWRNGNGLSAYIDTVMRNLVEDNMGGGSSNEASRNMTSPSPHVSGLTIGIESSAIESACAAAGQVTYEYGGLNLLAVLKGLHNTSHTYGGAAATPCYFDMSADAADRLTFRVFYGGWMDASADSGRAVHIGTRYGNLVMPRWQYDRTREVNAVRGEGYWGSAWAGWHIDYSRMNEAQLNRREGYCNAGEDGGAAAAALVNEGKPWPRFSGKILSTPICQFGLHWGLGTGLSVDYLGRQYETRVTGVGATVYGGKEDMSATFEVIS
jgi:hypothetical protein